MATVIDISQIPTGLTRRDVAAMAGLAKANTRGRMSGDANRMLDKLAADGYVFADPNANKPGVEKAVISQKEINLPSFHNWEDSKGYERSTKRIANARLNEYVRENPNFVKREVYANESRVAKNITRRNGVDSKPAPAPKVEPATANNFGPTAERVKPENSFEGYEYDLVDDKVVIGKRVNDAKGHALVRKSFKDADVISGYSIGYVPGDTFALDPRATTSISVLTPANNDALVVLRPVR